MVNWLRRGTLTGHVAEEGEIHQHSGWLIPLAVMVVVAVLCAALFLCYMRPFALSRNAAPFRDNRASLVAIPVNLAGMALSIPADYIRATARAGGERTCVALAPPFPTWQGYSEADARLFASNAPDSPLVHLLIRADPTAWTPGTAAAHLHPLYRQQRRRGRAVRPDPLRFPPGIRLCPRRTVCRRMAAIFCCCASSPPRNCPAPIAWRWTSRWPRA